jgi:hypothetical protein
VTTTAAARGRGYSVALKIRVGRWHAWCAECRTCSATVDYKGEASARAATHNQTEHLARPTRLAAGGPC